MTITSTDAAVILWADASADLADHLKAGIDNPDLAMKLRGLAGQLADITDELRASA